MPSLTILEKQGTSYICWQDVFQNGVPLLPNTVIDVWEDGTWQSTMEAVTNVSFPYQSLTFLTRCQAGYRSILSAPFYLNYISYGEDWPKYVVPVFMFGADVAQLLQH